MKPTLSTFLALSVLAVSQAAAAQQTTPPEPKITQTQLPPRVELPAPPGGQAEVPNRPLTADEAARIALAKQPDVTVARAQIQAAQGRTQQAQSGLNPNLGVDVTYSRIESLTTSGTTGQGGSTGRGFVQPGYQAAAIVRQLLFDFNHTRELVRQSRQFERAAEANLTRVQQDLVLQVKRAFYTFVENESLVVVNEGNVRNRQAHVDLAQARVRAGLGAPIDVVRAQTALSQSIFDLDSTRNNASQARVSLALQMGVDPRTPITAGDSDEPPPSSTDVNRLTDDALKLRPEVVQARAVLQAREHGVSAARTTNSPAVSASGGLIGRGQDLPIRSNSLTVGVGISWDPFDGGLTAGRVREARANVEVARADLRQAQLGVTADVAQAFLNLRTSEQRVTSAEAEVTNAQEALRLAEGRYRSGIGLFIDVVDAQSALLTARTDRVNAQSQIDQARAALKRAVGTPVGR